MRPRIFIGSSKEGLKIAGAVKRQLVLTAEVDLWNDQDVFPIGSLTLSALEARASRYDFALIVMTPDDVTRSRGAIHITPRDNLLFELGLFMGRIGLERTLIVRSDAPKMKLPSDLGGLVVALYKEESAERDLRRAVQPACAQVASRVEKLGVSEGRRAADIGDAADTMSRLVERTGAILSAFQESQSKPQWFESVDSAKGALLGLIQRLSDEGQPIVFEWLGMTMFNVWNTLPTILKQLERRNPKSVTLRVAMLSHEWLSVNRINTSWTANSADIQYNRIMEFKKELQQGSGNRWTVEVRRYSHMPAVHGGLINDKHLLLGLCQWGANDNLWAGDKFYELYADGDGNHGTDRIGIFKGWFNTCWKSAATSSFFEWSK